jgi:hypothetical protein
MSRVMDDMTVGVWFGLGFMVLVALVAVVVVAQLAATWRSKIAASSGKQEYQQLAELAAETNRSLAEVQSRLAKLEQARDSSR